jgi:hypothetical protein
MAMKDDTSTTPVLLQLKLNEEMELNSAIWAMMRLGQLIKESKSNAGFEGILEHDYIYALGQAIQSIGHYACQKHAESLDEMESKFKKLNRPIKAAAL